MTNASSAFIVIQCTAASSGTPATNTPLHDGIVCASRSDDACVVAEPRRVAHETGVRHANTTRASGEAAGIGEQIDLAKVVTAHEEVA
mmetsp:Transcript_8844/g.21521  ORF Transcript_8844/g.21521 Transcript_8844/m.21521 type:complete len:88 (+) Transcript_8844:74-337(+)